MNDVLTAQEAADRLGYHIAHLYKLLRSGFIQASQFNGVWVVPCSEVDRIKAMQGQAGWLPKGTVRK